MKIALPSEEAVEYAPDFGDNRERAADDNDPFIVTILPMTGADYDKLHSAGMGGKSMKPSALMKRADKFIRRLIEERVQEVRGFELCDSSGKVVATPTDGVELYRAISKAPPSVNAIIDDIVDALKDASALDEGALGNLRRLSALSPLKIPQSDTGPASDVAERTTNRTAETPSTSNLPSESNSAKPTERRETATETPRPVSSSPGIPN